MQTSEPAARAAFHQLKKIWRSSANRMTTNIRLLNAIVKPLLIYGAVTWRTNVATIQKYRSSSTPASGISSRSAGKIRSYTNNYRK
ncbi:hypothetical protein DPMN_130603 [Dreissena polymorpha]|uniref:DUF6451 domain-containing protein n=1 Tax=Dreissena polymorpha TaxID=45954 RepID=A0A9D4JYJ0_DREPO|nr:hypothetical protein DPMN_130603 [Dreissena polymorpha]